MRKMMIAMAVAGLCGLSAQPASAKWYVGKAGTDTCLPLEIASAALSGRVMHTPEEFRLAMTVLGLDLQVVPHTVQHELEYRQPGTDTVYMFFDDLAVCRKMMTILMPSTFDPDADK